MKLADGINWNVFEEEFGKLYSEEGRPGLPIRLMVGLQYLKHTFDASDENVVARWIENPYWQYFCGEEYFQHKFPSDPSQMTRFRNRIGEAGCELMLQLTIDAGITTKTISARSLEVVTVDTTVQEKAIAFPTDARLYQKARIALVNRAKKLDIPLRQTYTRVGKNALFMNARYCHAKQMKRAKREQRKLRTYLGRTIRDIERKSSDITDHRMSQLLEVAKRIHMQKRDDKKKCYSVHAPEVECIGKGKAHKKYEFGVKASFVTTNQNPFILGAKSLPGNPYDGHSLAQCLEQSYRLTHVAPQQAYVDQGYKKHEIHKRSEPINHIQVWISRTKRGVTTQIKRLMKRRNAIEPVIGHLKSDGRLGRNFLKGQQGDAMNVILCATGFNLRKILKHLRLLCARFYLSFLRIIFLQNAYRAA